MPVSTYKDLIRRHLNTGHRYSGNYRYDNGTRCVIGCLIDDEALDKIKRHAFLSSRRIGTLLKWGVLVPGKNMAKIPGYETEDYVQLQSKFDSLRACSVEECLKLL